MDRSKREFQNLAGEVVVLREIVKQMGWAEVQKIRASARQEPDSVKKKQMLSDAERLIRFLSLLKDSSVSQRGPHTPLSFEALKEVY